MPVLMSVDGKIIGNIESGVYTKKVKGSIHRLNLPPAWAIDKLAFDRLRGNCHTIVIEDVEARLFYRVSFENFDLRKVLTNRRFGPQYYLPLIYWTVSSSGQIKLI